MGNLRKFVENIRNKMFSVSDMIISCLKCKTVGDVRFQRSGATTVF
jgi:hypothetical protein